MRLCDRESRRSKWNFAAFCGCCAHFLHPAWRLETANSWRRRWKSRRAAPQSVCQLCGFEVLRRQASRWRSALKSRLFVIVWRVLSYGRYERRQGSCCRNCCTQTCWWSLWQASCCPPAGRQQVMAALVIFVHSGDDASMTRAAFNDVHISLLQSLILSMSNTCPGLYYLSICCKSKAINEARRKILFIKFNCFNNWVLVSDVRSTPF